MKTKRTSLAPMAVTSLMGGVRPARYNVQRDDWCGAQRSGASRKKNHHWRQCSLSLKYFTISTFYLFPRFVHQLQKTDSFFIAIFAANTVG